MLSTLETTASKIFSALDYQNKGAVPWRKSVVSRRCTPRFQLGDRLLCVRFRIPLFEEDVRQGGREKGRERDISAETPYMSLPSIQTGNTRPCTSIWWSLLCLSCGASWRLLAQNNMAFSHGYWQTNVKKAILIPGFMASILFLRSRNCFSRKQSN